ncbi:hypothetical protein ADUPG1_006706 [Aduncisulcus paluster]|uniref:Protein kinase domain-containing protein n=1 Tax=Aduncisulcus paluster TaxID=2918883 RepID=A0ABQ5KJ86_9EUKA|nr:hypothetical protein ADUPG1_006706 [Aduncisulcus paluster]
MRLISPTMKIGTQMYMAPEIDQAIKDRVSPHPTPSSDVFSFGVLLQCVFCEWEGGCMPAEVEGICKQCMDERPENRPSAAQILMLKWFRPLVCEDKIRMRSRKDRVMGSNASELDSHPDLIQHSKQSSQIHGSKHLKGAKYEIALDESDSDRESHSEMSKRMDPNGFFETAKHDGIRRATFSIGTSNVTSRCVAVGGRGSLMFCGNDDGTVVSFEPDVYPLHEYRSYNTPLLNTTMHGSELLSLSTNHGILASSDTEGIVRLWKEEDLKELRIIKHPKAVYEVGLYDDCIIGCCKDTFAYMWNTSTGELLTKFEGHSKGVYCCSRSGNNLITGSADHTVKSWDIERQKLIGTVQKHKARVRCVDTVHDGRVIASGGAEKKIFFADKRQPKSKTLYLSGHKKDISFLHVDGAKIISTSYDGFVRLWDIRGIAGDGSKPVCALKLQLSEGQILGACIDGYRVYCASSCGKIECIEF